MKTIMKVLYCGFIICVISGGVTLFYSMNKFGNAYSKIKQQNEVIKAQHTKELSGTPDVLKTYSNIEGIKITVDNYIETVDTITMDITVDSTDFGNTDSFDLFHDEVKIPDSVIEQRNDFGTITADVVTFDTDFNDETFKTNLINECFMSSYDLSKHFEDIKTSTEVSSDYGFLINEPIKIKYGQVNGFTYNDKKKFTVILNKNTVRMIRFHVHYRGTGLKTSDIYMLINDNY